MGFAEKAQLDRVGCFKYSEVEGAKANQFDNLIPEEVKQQRLDEFMGLQAKISADKFIEIFKANIISLTLVAKHFIPKLAKDKKSIFTVISAQVGSISDNQLGDWYAYRA